MLPGLWLRIPLGTSDKRPASSDRVARYRPAPMAASATSFTACHPRAVLRLPHLDTLPASPVRAGHPGATHTTFQTYKPYRSLALVAAPFIKQHFIPSLRRSNPNAGLQIPWERRQILFVLRPRHINPDVLI